ncbi:MAG: RtcB family protein [Clostridia bacterium]|nr:RtcB family protein [Clostridia bacterium]
MFEIKGKYNTAVCFASVVEESAVAQIMRMCNYPFTQGSRIRIMPDVHAGKGCTIGTTMTIKDKVVPNIVGVDIGCGMYTVNLGKADIDFARVDEACHFIPSGKNVWEGRKKHIDLTPLRCYRELKDPRRLVRSLGTLGGGNHFIEIDESPAGDKFLIIHSGSRNLGKQVAEHYQRLAIDLNKGKDELFKAKQRIIDLYKSEGRRSEIQAELKRMDKEWASKHSAGDTPEDLCFVYGQYLEDYLADVAICQQFARESRELMAEIICEMCGFTPVEAFHTIHNYIDLDGMILRKGAISARKGEKVLIPINMRDGSVLATGRGNKEWNFSAPHGAGRIMSRSAAKETLSLDEYRKSMEGIYTTSVSGDTIDEAPMAYKSIQDIIGDIADSVDIIDVLHPVFNFKAAE